MISVSSMTSVSSLPDLQVVDHFKFYSNIDHLLSLILYVYFKLQVIQ